MGMCCCRDYGLVASTPRQCRRYFIPCDREMLVSDWFDFVFAKENAATWILAVWTLYFDVVAAFGNVSPPVYNMLGVYFPWLCFSIFRSGIRIDDEAQVREISRLEEDCWFSGISCMVEKVTKFVDMVFLALIASCTSGPRPSMDCQFSSIRKTTVLA